MSAEGLVPVTRVLSQSKGRRLRRLMRSSDMEFLPASLEILERPPSPLGSGVVMAICAFFAVALVWGYFGRIDIVSVAQGKFQPTGRVKLVQPVETGKVVALRAENGQSVSAGEVLVELDPKGDKADADEARAMTDSFEAEVARRRTAIAVVEKVEDAMYKPDGALADGTVSSAMTKAMKEPLAVPTWPEGVAKPTVEREASVLKADLRSLRAQFLGFEAQVADKASERRRLEDTVASQRRLVGTLQTRVDMKSTLVDRNAGSKADVIDATETLQEQQTTLAQQLGQLAQTETTIAVVRADMGKAVDAFLSDNAQRLAEAQRQADDYGQRANKATARLADTSLRSPIAGTVQSSTITSVGQVVTAGEEVMRVVPRDAELEIECYVPNRDIGFVREGQEAVVKVESFPFTRYGTLKARVVRVAHDAIPAPDADLNETDPARATRANAVAGGQRVQNLVFPVTLRAARSTMEVDGTQVQMTPGMATTVEIRTGDRRILEYVFSPVVQTMSEAMKER